MASRGVLRRAAQREPLLERLDHLTRPGGGAGAPGGLSPREVDVLRLIARGASTKEIAQTLVLRQPTVERHITHLYTKIGARARADATAFALSHGLSQPDVDSDGFPSLL
jgi:DNA-binding NarL/FixJ family response regulator